MKYSLVVDTYEKIEATPKRLEMRDHLANLFKQTPKDIISKVTYLTQGKLYPEYKGIELGLADKLIVRALSLSSGKTEKSIITSFRKEGDLEFIQSDVTVLLGSSGGPLLDVNGNVVGICVSGIGMGLNLNFFIPIQEAIGALNIKFK